MGRRRDRAKAHAVADAGASPAISTTHIYNSRELMLERYWLAGLLEGEGSFMRGAPSDPKYIRISITMRDRDIIERVARQFGVQFIQEAPGRRENWNTTYQVKIKGGRAETLMRQLHPVMGHRRQQQITTALESIPTGIVKRHTAASIPSWTGRPIPEASKQEQIAWLAGLLEGEGSFQAGLPSKPNAPSIQLQMRDLDVVAQVAQFWNVTAYQVRQAEGAISEAFKARLRGRRSVEWMQAILPWMGQRRTEQIERAISSYRPVLVTAAHRLPLEEEDVLDIYARACAGENYQQIADDYADLGVSRNTIKDIKNGRSWRWLTSAGR